MADLNLIPPPEGQDAPAPASHDVGAFIGFVKAALGDAVADVRVSDRLTESAVCLVASEQGMDRHLGILLAKAGQLPAATKPVLEINPRHPLITKLASLGETDQPLREDAAHLLFDEARIADGAQPVDPRDFSARLARVIGCATG